MTEATFPMPEVGIPHVAYYLPERTVSVREWGRRTNQHQERIEGLLSNGVRGFLDAGAESPTDLGVKAVRLLLVQARMAPSDVDLLIYTHTMPSSAAPPPASAVGLVQAACRLHRALSFSISQQNCVSPLMAIKIVQHMMANRPELRRAIVVTVDLMGSAAVGIRGILDFAIQSDGACAFVLERDALRNRLLACHLYTDGRFFRGIDANNQLVADEKYHWSAFATIRSTLHQAGLKPEDLRRILPNHVNKAGWLRILSWLKLTQERLFMDNFDRIGHVFGSDPFINFADEDKQPGSFYLLFSSGLAGCFGAIALRH